MDTNNETGKKVTKQPFVFWHPPKNSHRLQYFLKKYFVIKQLFNSKLQPALKKICQGRLVFWPFLSLYLHHVL